MKVNHIHSGQFLILNDVAYRIDRIYENGECILERTSDHAVVVRSKEELLKSFEDGFLRLDGSLQSDNKTLNRSSIDIATLSEENLKIIIRKKEYVNTAEQILGTTPTKKGINPVIKKVANLIDDKHTPSPSTVVRWWKNWLNSGRDILCFLNHESGSAKPRKFKGAIANVIKEVINEYYLTVQRNNTQTVYNILCNRIFELNKVRLNNLVVPSRPTFYRIINSLDKYESVAARLGKNVADSKFRSVGKGIATKYILERVEVDHTPMDVMVVNEKTGLVDGRPWATALIDRHSRMILWLEIGFEPPSELSVMNALRSAITPKTKFSEKYPRIVSDWPAYGIPTTLVCDNGLEFHALNLKRMCTELNIELQFCPKKQPNYKGAIERFWLTLNKAVCHRIPGTTFSNINQRSQYASEKMAKVTLNELRAITYEWLVDIYSHEINRTSQKTPYAMWKDGLQKREPLIPESIQQLNLILTKELVRTLNHEGVTIFGLAYNSEELSLIRRRSDKTFHVKVRYDPANLRCVWVYDEINGDYLSVPCVHLEYAEALSLVTHKSIRSIDKQAGRNEQDLLLLLKKKAKFSDQLHALSTSKRIKPRQRAERHSIHKVPVDLNTKKMTELRKQNALNFSGIDIANIPKFSITQREDI